MAARSIASITISFGLVSIPVKLFSATESSKAISFNLLHKGCGSRLKQQYLCAKEEIPVSREEMVKGYEFAKDQYVMFTPEKGGAKPYALLAKALLESDRCAIGRWAARGKQYIVMIRPVESADGYRL